MRLYEKILKNINDIGISTHMNSIEATQLKYDYHANNKIRNAFLHLKNDGFINLTFNKNGKLLFVERLPKGITYFEYKRKDDFRFWLPIAISIVALIISIMSLLINLLQQLSGLIQK